MKRVLFLSCILAVCIFWSWPNLAAEQKSSEDSRCQVELLCCDNLEAKSIVVEVSSDRLVFYKYIGQLFRGGKLRVNSSAEISAFKKMISFLSDDLEDYRDSEDFVELICFIAEYGVLPLGDKIAKDMQGEIYQKLNTASKSPVFLDSLNKERFELLFELLGQKIETPWFKSLKDTVVKYTNYLIFMKDERVVKLKQQIDPNLLVYNYFVKRKDEKTQKNLRATQEFDEALVAIITPIKAEVERLSSDFDMQFSFPVPKKYASIVRQKLADYFFNFDVSLNVGEWSSEADLCCSEDWPASVGGCCATACGWFACLSFLPLQCLTCNYCCCCTKSKFLDCDCSLENLFSTQLGGAVRHCVYKVGSCGWRWIILKAKQQNVFITFPPIEMPDMTRDVGDMDV